MKETGSWAGIISGESGQNQVAQSGCQNFLDDGHGACLQSLSNTAATTRM